MGSADRSPHSFFDSCLFLPLFGVRIPGMRNETKSTSVLREKLAVCLNNRPEILFALLYGSAAEGLPFRDLDIGLFVDRTMVSAAADLDYSFTLADELEKAVSYSVDVWVINDAPLGFRYNVSRGMALVVNDEQIFYNFLERTWDEFLDFQPVAMQYLKELR